MAASDKFRVLTGCNSFARLIQSNAYYVDKTSYLQKLFISYPAKNDYFLRPSRFGKTLNLSMIKAFCKLNYQNPGDITYQQKLFIDNGRNFAVAQDEYKELRDKVMGQIPVIYVSFSSVQGDNFYLAVNNLLYIIKNLYEKHLFLLQSSKLSDGSKLFF